MTTMKEAFEDLIKDTYNAEKQIEKALPKAIKKVSDPSLKEALENHLEETKHQIQNVEKIAEKCGFKPTGVVCHGMKGLLEEVEEHLSEAEEGPVLDAMIIANSQKVEHYEICAYGTARAWAQQLGIEGIVDLIEENLHQEEAADEKMNKIALKCVNPDASGEGAKTPAGKASVR